MKIVNPTEFQFQVQFLDCSVSVDMWYWCCLMKKCKFICNSQLDEAIKFFPPVLDILPQLGELRYDIRGFSKFQNIGNVANKGKSKINSAEMACSRDRI